MKKTLYDDLGVKRGATKQEISKAYKTLAKRYHPDLQTDERAKKKAEKEMIQINIAYETLKDDIKRREYDNQLLAEEEERRLEKERARQQQENFNNANAHNNQEYYIRYEFVSPTNRINYDRLLKLLLGFGIFIALFGIIMVIPGTRKIIIDFYNSNSIFKLIIDILLAIYSAFSTTIAFIKNNIGKGTF